MQESESAKSGNTFAHRMSRSAITKITRWRKLHFFRNLFLRECNNALLGASHADLITLRDHKARLSRQEPSHSLMTIRHLSMHLRC